MQRATLSRLAVTPLLVAPLLIAPVARATDGVFEINRACVGTGCSPGDTPGCP